MRLGRRWPTRRLGAPGGGRKGRDVSVTGQPRAESVEPLVPTMRDVAERAGVGLATVSRVVNDAGSVRPATAERVRAAILELGFHRDEVARALRPGQHSRTVGLLLGDLTNPFYATLAKAAVAAANAQRFAVVLSTVDEDPEVERQAIAELVGRRIAGLVIVPDQGDYRFLRDATGRRPLPVVFVDRPSNGADGDSVVLDNEGGGRMATTHLLAHGHRRVAVLVAPSYWTTGRRLRGYRRALRDAGVPVDERLVVTLRQGTPGEAEAATRALLALEDPPTALFCTTGFLAEGAIRAIGPATGSVAVVGFDDVPLADLLPVPLTIVATDAERLAETAVELLLARVSDPSSPPAKVVLPVRLLQRGSGEVLGPLAG
ncbi:transcriptional regulator, LacI family [Microlunatus sagamiharensis]|uniref:Transcriptional regulator, LacI family n=2 Tax=Microlunatus sagamiharensis TaxID=546874 RepID=A0A1H2N124_9ACTN|nr:transcriptional regulator, LacI family [Microlunatus sagamiharensis]